MTQPDLIIRARRMITPDGERSGAVGIRDGVIVAVEPELDGPVFVDLADDEVLLPGLVDTHVHVNDPGRTEWEGFATATRAAAAGGVTTIVDMPLNSVPPTVDVPALDIKRATAFGHTHVDVGFWGGAVPGNLARAACRCTQAGVFGFKCFLLHSGVDEFGHLSPGELAAALEALQRPRRADDRARRGPRPDRARAAAARPRLPRTSSRPGRRTPSTGRSRR